MEVDLYKATYVSIRSVCQVLHIGREPYMVNNLVRNATIVLQDIKVLSTASLSDLLRDGLYKNTPVSIHYQPTMLA